MFAKYMNPADESESQIKDWYAYHIRAGFTMKKICV